MLLPTPHSDKIKAWGQVSAFAVLVAKNVKAAVWQKNWQFMLKKKTRKPPHYQKSPQTNRKTQPTHQITSKTPKTKKEKTTKKKPQHKAECIMSTKAQKWLKRKFCHQIRKEWRKGKKSPSSFLDRRANFREMFLPALGNTL